MIYILMMGKADICHSTEGKYPFPIIFASTAILLLVTSPLSSMAIEPSAQEGIGVESIEEEMTEESTYSWPEVPKHVFRPKDPALLLLEEQQAPAEIVDEIPTTDEGEPEAAPEKKGGSPMTSGKMEPGAPTKGDATAAPADDETVDIPEPVPDANLIDQNYNNVNFESLKGKVVLLTFFYTECKYGHCTYLNSKMKFIGRKFIGRLGTDLMLISVSFDPSIDTVEVLKEYSAKWEPDPTKWGFLTGPEEDIVNAAKRFDIIFRWDDGDLSYSHSIRTFLVDREGKLVRTYRGMDYDHNDAIADIRKLLNGETLPEQEPYLVPTDTGEEETLDDLADEEDADKGGDKTKGATKGKSKGSKTDKQIPAKPEKKPPPKKTTSGSKSR